MMAGLLQNGEPGGRVLGEVVLYGEWRCHKTRYYADALEERGVAYRLADVGKDRVAADELTAIAGRADKFPTFLINGRKLRNPKLPELDKHLARAGLFEPGLIHDEKSQRFIRYMSPSDGFVSYSVKGRRMVLSHIELDRSLRGSGRGAHLAGEVFDALLDAPCEVRITCPFLRQVAATRQDWRNKFLPGE